ncbi:MAG: cation-translocating P-type ATPase [Planctomycetaceae bacterium]|jgi:heavy metal translocating P-type ATPase|nr:cation-translocating P-type ATPase [Planctomycetaceae bacterium]
MSNLNDNDSVSSCCCRVRPAETEKSNEKNNGENNSTVFYSNLSNLYEILEPYFIAVSGLSLLASFFHFVHTPFDMAWVAVLLCGTPIFYDAVKTLWKLRISVEVLISTAILATIIADIFFPAESHHSYIFAGGEVAFIMALGHSLEAWTIARARAGIENLVRMTPQTARKCVDNTCVDNTESIIPASEVQCNDLLRVLPGETIPVDGEIVSGNTSIDQSLMTGESLPVDRFEGDTVFGGTINCFGSFTMRATRIGEDSSLARMIQLVRNAEQKKARIERIADRWAAVLVPIALMAAVAVGVITYFVLGQSGESWQESLREPLRRAVTILVVFCPCSLVLATPTAIIAAIGNASRYGILIRSGEALEQLSKVNVLAFDKTGTLTHGQLRLTAAQSFDNEYDSNGVLALAASVETLSEHPLASCIVKAAAEKHLELEQTSEFEMFRGEGIIVQLSGVLSGDLVIVGNDRMLKRYALELSDFQKTQAEKHFKLGETVIWVARQSRDRLKTEVVGFLALADTIRETSKKAVEQIQSNGVEVMLLTGDNDRSAQTIGEQSGILNIRANLLPDSKVAVIEEMQHYGSLVGMVGDGLNDAPALKTADVGIAMGRVGSDLTVDAADIVLIGDDISRLPFLVQLARKTKRTIFANIILSMGINVVAILLASAGIMGPIVGALVHNAGSILVVLNASLILNIRREKE